MSAAASAVTRAEIEAFLFEEAALLDSWRLDDWLGLLTEDVRYLVPLQRCARRGPPFDVVHHRR